MRNGHLGRQDGAKLDPSWAKLGPSWAKLGLSCDLEPSWRPLEAVQDAFFSSYRRLLVFISSCSRLGAVWSRFQRERELLPGVPWGPTGAGGERGEGIKNPSQ